MFYLNGSRITSSLPKMFLRVLDLGVEGSEWLVSAQVRARPQQRCDLSELLQGQHPDPQCLLQPDNQVG